jgi:hypothetical protein
VRLTEAQLFRGDALLQLLLSTCCLFVSLKVRLHKQTQGPVISKVLCCRLAALVTADRTNFCPAEYTSAGLHVLNSCSTRAADLGAIFKYVHVYALSLTCLRLHPSCKSIFKIEFALLAAARCLYAPQFWLLCSA